MLGEGANPGRKGEWHGRARARRFKGLLSARQKALKSERDAADCYRSKKSEGEIMGWFASWRLGRRRGICLFRR